MTDFKKLMGIDVEVPQIKLRDLGTLVHYEKNARTHSPAQVEEIVGSLLEFGWTHSVLVDEHGIVAGHGRCMAAELIYRQGKQINFPGGSPIPIGFVPTIDCTGWSEAQRKAYILADNRIALNAGWDVELLSAELRELEAVNFNLHVMGFSEDELTELLAPVVEVPELGGDPDALPEDGQPLVSVPGDVWVCGPHRVACGDCTSVDDIDRLMQGEVADAVFTDPPYNVDLGKKNRRMDKAIGGTRSATGSIANDKLTEAEFGDLLAGAFAGLFTVMKPGAVMYVAHSDKAAGQFRTLFEAAGFHFSQMLVWKKNNLVVGMADFQPIHEPIMYGWKPGAKHRFYGGRKQTTVMEVGAGGPIQQLEDGRWAIKIGDQVLLVDGHAKLEEAPSTIFHVPKPERSGLHASQKPVELIERMLKNSARAGDVVVDFFSGSGSTLIAADRLGMCARVMDLNPVMADTAVRRWMDYTGRMAVHAVTGKPFEVRESAAAEEQPVPDMGFDLDSDISDLF